MAKSKTCYFGTGEDKKLLTIAQALEQRRRTGNFIGRCVECDGPVMANSGSAKMKMAAHFEHFARNENCNWSDPHRKK
jgi:hypothetical protein